MGRRTDRITCPHLEELPQRLDELEVEVLGQATDVVVALDGVAVLLALARRGTRLDDVWIQCALPQVKPSHTMLYLMSRGHTTR
jgi:hypothetical protein